MTSVGRQLDDTYNRQGRGPYLGFMGRSFTELVGSRGPGSCFCLVVHLWQCPQFHEHCAAAGMRLWTLALCVSCKICSGVHILVLPSTSRPIRPSVEACCASRTAVSHYLALWFLDVIGIMISNMREIAVNLPGDGVLPCAMSSSFPLGSLLGIPTFSIGVLRRRRRIQMLIMNEDSQKVHLHVSFTNIACSFIL